MPRKRVRRTTKQRVDPFDDSAWRWSLPGGGELDALARGVTRVSALNEGYTTATVRANTMTVSRSKSAWFVADEAEGLATPYTSDELLSNFAGEVLDTFGNVADKKRLPEAYLRATGRKAKDSISTPHGTGVLRFGPRRILWHRDDASAQWGNVPRLLW